MQSHTPPAIFVEYQKESLIKRHSSQCFPYTYDIRRKRQIPFHDCIHLWIVFWGSTDKFSHAVLAHLFRPAYVDKSST